MVLVMMKQLKLNLFILCFFTIVATPLLAIGFNQTIEKLKQNDPSLTSLDLGGNQNGIAGAQALAETLQTNRTLTTLNLDRDKIGDVEIKNSIEASLKRNQAYVEQMKEKISLSFEMMFV